MSLLLDMATFLVDCLEPSNFFTAGGTRLHEALSYTVGNGESVSDAFIHLEDLRKIYEKKENVILAFDLEKDILFRISQQILQNETEMLLATWASKDEKNYASQFLMINPYQDANLQIAVNCLLFAAQKIQRSRSEQRSCKVIEIPELLLPFTSDEGLITVTDFKHLTSGYLDSNSSLVVYPRFSYELKTKLDKVDTKINDLQVSPKKIEHFSKYTGLVSLNEERMFGMPFRKENFANIYSKVYGEFRYNFSSRVDESTAKLFFAPLDRLEFVLKPYEGHLISLSLEEVIDTAATGYRLLDDHLFILESGEQMVKHRYLHLVMNKKTANVVHLDMSWLLYRGSKISQRKAQHIKDKVVSADDKIKLFRVDAKKGQAGIDFDLFIDISGSAMEADRNPEILRFFNGE